MIKINKLNTTILNLKINTNYYKIKYNKNHMEIVTLIVKNKAKRMKIEDRN